MWFCGIHFVLGGMRQMMLTNAPIWFASSQGIYESVKYKSEPAMPDEERVKLLTCFDIIASLDSLTTNSMCELNVNGAFM